MVQLLRTQQIDNNGSAVETIIVLRTVGKHKRNLFLHPVFPSSVMLRHLPASIQQGSLIQEATAPTAAIM
jgi:hypothetical protein